MSAKKDIYIFTVIGLLLGFATDLLLRYHNPIIFYYVLISLFCLLYALAYNETHEIRLIASSFIIAWLLSLAWLPIRTDLNPPAPNLEHWFTFVAAFPAFAYVAHSFHYAYHHDNTWRVNYSTLFAAVWNTILLLFVGVLFASLAYLLIFLGAFVFKAAGNEYLWNLLINNIHFRLISNITLFFIGLGIGQQNIKIIFSLRFLLLRMMYYLFPFLALISVVYFFLYLFARVTPPSEDEINPLMILIPLVSIGILFFNAYYQDGNVKTGTPLWLQGFLKVYRVILWLLAIMMTYRVLSHFSVDVNIVIYLITIILYSFIYAITIWLSPDREQKWIQKGNIATALFFIVALFLVNLPYFPIVFNVGRAYLNS